MAFMREIEPIEALTAYCAQFKSRAEAARTLGIHRAFLHHMLNYGKSIPDSVLSQLGLKRIVVKGAK
jgi:hypothetical protein